MLKSRIFFVAALLCSFCIIVSYIGLFKCLSTNIYSYDSLEDYTNDYFINGAMEVSDACADILDENTFTFGANAINRIYKDSFFGVRMFTDDDFARTFNYSRNIIYSTSYEFSVIYTNHLATYYRHDDGSTIVYFEISLVEGATEATYDLWNARYAYLISSILSTLSFATCLFFIGFFERKKRTILRPAWLNPITFPAYLITCSVIIAIHIFALYWVIKDSDSVLSIIISVSLSISLSIFFTGIVLRAIDNRIIKELFVYKFGQKHGLVAQGILIGIYCIIILLTGIITSHCIGGYLWIISLIVIAAMWIAHIKMLNVINNTINHYAEGDWISHPNNNSILLNNINEQMSSLSSSIQIVVEKSVRDERTKTELITNVSHDIKTPLTSIINYIDLLDNENLSEESRQEYLEVLKKNSARMKKLIEDLIEASKASTGNIELEPVNCCIDTLISQAIVEHEPDAELRNLVIVFDQAEEPIYMTIDGKYLYRVFNNLLSNAVKYSLSGSRIYITLTEKSICFKNTTEDRITMSPDELTERFVKGDMSRHSEGSGLGLAICKSLTEMMGGTLNINIDGDQFMVTLNF